MADITVLPGQFNQLYIAGRGQGPTPTTLQAGSVTVKIDNYTAGYVADMGAHPSGIGRVIGVVGKPAGIPPGGNVQTSIRVNGVDQVSGTALQETVFTVELDASAPPPPAASVFGLFANNNFSQANTPVPPDPGSDTVTF